MTTRKAWQFRWTMPVFLAAFCLAGGCRPKEPATAVTPAAADIAVSAEIVRASRLPDAKRSDYPDCNFTCEMEVREIRGPRRVPRRIVVMLPGFRKREPHWCASLPPGAMLDLALVAAAAATPEMKTMQRADDLDDFALPLYFATEVRRCPRQVSAFEVKPESYFLASAPVAAPAGERPATVRYPWSEKAARERRAAIQRDTDARLAALQANGGSWDAWSDRIAPFIIEIGDKVRKAGGSLAQGGAYFERLHWKQYYELSRLADEGKPGPVKMLEQLNRELRARGIDLIVVPFPYKEEVHAEVFTANAPADGICEPWRQKFILQLLERDIEVVDLVPALRAARGRFPLLFYDAHDNHPALGAIQVAAEQIAQRLERYELAARRSGASPTFQTREAAWVASKEAEDLGFTPGRSYPCLQVLDAQGREIQITQDRDSAVVIMGDSYTVTPAPMVTSAALPMHLARLLGEVPNQILSIGGSDQAMQLLAREGGDFFANRCALVFVFAPTKLDGEASAPSGKRPWNWVDLPPISFPEEKK